MGLKISGKITAALMSLILAVGCIIPAAAVAITYTIPEIDEMTVTMPDGITAVTRDSADTDKYFSVFGIDYEQTMRNFENGNIYLQGMDEKSEVTISVTMTQTEESKGISNYNLLSKEKLGEVQANFLSQDEYTTCTVEDGGKIVWLYFNVNVNEGGKTIKAYQANTVYDGKSVNITLQRNGGNVNEADYNTFSLIVSAADFKQVGSFNNLIPYILIGGAVIAALVIIFIIAASRHASHKRKKNKNDKLIEELADKYTTRRNHRSYARNGAADNGGQFEEFTDISSSSGRNETSAAEPEKADPEQEEAENYSEKYDFESYRSNVKRYSDEEIDKLLGIEPEKQENAENSSEGEQKPEEPKKKEAFVTAAELSKDDEISEFFESVEHEKAEAAEQEKQEAAQQENQEITESEAPENAEQSEAASEPEKSLEDAATRKFEKIKDSDDDVQIYSRSADKRAAESDEEPDEYEEFNNDEVLVRDEAKHKFTDGYDYFEEAPKKKMGVISSKDIIDAEDYDVINEVEKKVTEVEKTGPGAGETVVSALKKFGSGVKSFGVHCGYFATNLSRMIKRKRAISKRKKAEEARRARERERAARQRQQRQNIQDGKLVQVHSRGARPPQQRTSSQHKRPPQRKPNSRG